MADLFSKAIKKKNNEFEPNLHELAKTPYGELEITKYLYESGLQNIFEDYQKSMSALSKQEQQSLQDAYFIREMSKKYLGEYASNVGLGDVSDSLLDIYGQYQQNLGAIRQSYDALRLNLTHEYNKAREETMRNLLLTNYGIEVAKLSEKTQQVMHNIIIGETEGYDRVEYLQKHRNLIGEHNYRAIYETLYSLGLLGQSDLEFHDIMNPGSKHYVGDDYDFKLMTGENVDKNSIGFIDPAGNKKFSVVEDADNDPKFDITGEEVYKIFDKNYQEGLVNHAVPVQGDIVIARGYNSETNSTELVEYIFNNGRWHRLVTEKPFSQDEMKLWRIPENKKNIELTNFKASKNSVTFNGITWVAGEMPYFAVNENFELAPIENVATTLSGDPKVVDAVTSASTISITVPATPDKLEIAKLFKETHGYSKDTTFVMYNGDMYMFRGKEGNIYKMKRKKE